MKITSQTQSFSQYAVQVCNQIATFCNKYGSNYIHPEDGDSTVLRNSDNHQRVDTGITETTEMRKKTKEEVVRNLEDKSEKTENTTN